MDTFLLRIFSLSIVSLSCQSLTTRTTRTTKSFSSATTRSKITTAIGQSSSTLNDNKPSWFSTLSSPADFDKENRQGVDDLKIQLLQLGAALDRGQAYNPTSGSYYEENMNVARDKIEQLLSRATNKNRNENSIKDEGDVVEGIDNNDASSSGSSSSSSSSSTIPTKLNEIAGEWELVLSTVPHGIFRSSPFFLAIQESYEYAETKTFEDGTSKPGLFFKLHELQTCSWGVSKVGRIAQYIDTNSKYLYSTFDTSLFSLTVIPILGWFKLLPTFGGCVVTAATMKELEPDVFQDRKVARLDMVVDYTTSRKVEGLNGLPLLGDIIWKIKVPVGAIWKLLPWNQGRDASCKVYINYVDDDFRIVQDIDGEYFVYTRPVVPRELQI